MKLNKKIIFLIGILFVIFTSQINASCYDKICNKYVGGGASIVVALVGSVVYYIFYIPYHMQTPTTGSYLSNALKNAYGDPLTNAKAYDEVPTIASHNSFTFPDETIQTLSPKSALFQNQILNVTQQLEFGVRTFLIDIYTDREDPNAPIEFSHAAGGRTLSFTRDWIPFLEEIRDFLIENPNEIVTLHLESYVGNYSKIMRDMRNTTLSNYAYIVPRGSTNWDTRDRMIRNNRRLLIFSDAQGDFGSGIMNTRDHILENHYDEEECVYRDFARLKFPLSCNLSTSGINAYRCIKGEMASTPVGRNNNRGAILFLLNHYHIPNYHLLKRIFPTTFSNVIKNYFRTLNSYDVIRNRIRSCYCNFTIPNNTLLSTPSGFVNSTSQNIVELGTYPHTIALDFIGEEETDEGIRGIIRDMLLNNFTIPSC